MNHYLLMLHTMHDDYPVVITLDRREAVRLAMDTAANPDKPLAAACRLWGRSIGKPTGVSIIYAPPDDEWQVLAHYTMRDATKDDTINYGGQPSNV